MKCDRNVILTTAAGVGQVFLKGQDIPAEFEASFTPRRVRGEATSSPPPVQTPTARPGPVAIPEDVRTVPEVVAWVEAGETSTERRNRAAAVDDAERMSSTPRAGVLNGIAPHLDGTA